jgi:hypothetical protein
LNVYLNYAPCYNGIYTQLRCTKLEKTIEYIIKHSKEKDIIINVDLLHFNEIEPYFKNIFFKVCENFPYKTLYIESNSEIRLRKIRKLMYRNIIAYSKRINMRKTKWIFSIHEGVSNG